MSEPYRPSKKERKNSDMRRTPGLQRQNNHLFKLNRPLPMMQRMRTKVLDDHKHCKSSP